VTATETSTYIEDEHGNLIGPDGTVIPAGERTKPEVYSRCCGYLRPVEAWHTGKQAEYRDRKLYQVDRPIADED